MHVLICHREKRKYEHMNYFKYVFHIYDKAPLIQSQLTLFDLSGARVSAVLQLLHGFVDVINPRLNIRHVLS